MCMLGYVEGGCYADVWSEDRLSSRERAADHAFEHAALDSRSHGELTLIDTAPSAQDFYARQHAIIW